MSHFETASGPSLGVPKTIRQLCGYVAVEYGHPIDTKVAGDEAIVVGHHRWAICGHCAPEIGVCCALGSLYVPYIEQKCSKTSHFRTKWWFLEKFDH